VNNSSFFYLRRSRFLEFLFHDQVAIDKYYDGGLIKTEGYGWQVHLHPTTLLQEEWIRTCIRSCGSGSADQVACTDRFSLCIALKSEE